MINTPPTVFALIDKTRPIQKAYEKSNAQIRLVGGCVRDALLGKIAKDIDLATPLPPEDGMNLLKNEGITCIPTGIQHGTFTALLDHEAYEITTLRQDVVTDGRHAHVVFSNDWEIDAARRDLTINALYADLDGVIYDYFEGMKDLQQGIIRFIGNAEARIKEDYLRILRLFRFHAWYGKYPLDDHTLKVCQELADRLSHLSKERVTKEIFRLLEAKNPLTSLSQMATHQILPPLFQDNALPHITDLMMWEERLQLPINPLRRLLILTKDYTLFRLSKTQASYIKKEADLIRINMFNEVQRRYFLSIETKETIRDALLLKYCQGLHEIQIHDRDLQARIEEINHLQIPLFPLNGNHLINMGIKGAKIGALLSQCRWWWAENEYNPTIKMCIEWIKHHLKAEI
jgi:poly(A) polymerase